MSTSPRPVSVHAYVRSSATIPLRERSKCRSVFACEFNWLTACSTKEGKGWHVENPGSGSYSLHTTAVSEARDHISGLATHQQVRMTTTNPWLRRVNELELTLLYPWWQNRNHFTAFHLFPNMWTVMLTNVINGAREWTSWNHLITPCNQINCQSYYLFLFYDTHYIFRFML